MNPATEPVPRIRASPRATIWRAIHGEEPAWRDDGPKRTGGQPDPGDGRRAARATAAFCQAGQTDVAETEKAHLSLAPLLGSARAPTLFGVAPLRFDLNSTATMAGQFVLKGVINLRIAPWARRLIPRRLAIIPAPIIVPNVNLPSTVPIG